MPLSQKQTFFKATELFGEVTLKLEYNINPRTSNTTPQYYIFHWNPYPAHIDYSAFSYKSWEEALSILQQNRDKLYPPSVSTEAEVKEERKDENDSEITDQAV
jgi:hypothetical protein